ncbi:Redoxin domain protein [Mycolicibacterium rhodesiae JS60]|nr:Redoxin domain protein [Mycolicibacterium rhodesiae JS60]
MRIAYALVLLGTTIGLVAGCGGSADPAVNVGSQTPSTSARAVSSTAAATPAQLNFTAKTVDGRNFSGETLAGKPVVVWFWAPWCPTCQREAAEVAKLARANPAVTFVGVAALDQQPAMHEFVTKYDLGFFTNIADVDGAVWQRFGVTAQPAFAFVHADGFVNVVRGPIPESELTTLVDALTKS